MMPLRATPYKPQRKNPVTRKPSVYVKKQRTKKEKREWACVAQTHRIVPWRRCTYDIDLDISKEEIEIKFVIWALLCYPDERCSLISLFDFKDYRRKFILWIKRGIFPLEWYTVEAGLDLDAVLDKWTYEGLKFCSDSLKYIQGLDGIDQYGDWVRNHQYHESFWKYLFRFRINMG